MTTTLALAGDVMLGRGVAEELRRLRPDEPWGDLLPLLAAADLRFVNLECAITPSPGLWERTPKMFLFRAEPRAIEALRAARIDAVALANNHTLDAEVGGLRDTLALLDGAGIRHAGAGETLADARRPAVVSANGTRVGLVAMTDNEEPFAAGPRNPGTNYLPISLDAEVLDVVEGMVAAARAAGAEVVVLSSHWGPNMVARPPPLFRRFAHAVIERGVDVFWGHSAHVVQGVEVYLHRPILYDTGDFLDDYAIDPEMRNDRSFLFRVQLEGAVPAAVELVPAMLTYAQVNRARGAEAAAIVARMRELSRELGTEFSRGGDGLLLPL
jgi:poly-gamma-glutamate capsule biosynthesis protein CapA/YwtB (metallophosphatase superfamily)